jgi:hypothetical protein
MQWRAHISNARFEKHISNAILHPQISRRNVHLTFRVEMNIVRLTAKTVRVIRDFVHISTRNIPAEHALKHLERTKQLVRKRAHVSRAGSRDQCPIDVAPQYHYVPSRGLPEQPPTVLERILLQI